ncbi:senescence/dehydration-associated protein At4g35985, chloroplastic-like isoform X1 [Sesamum indicum]|uniref:Senescence/dehydration-associated protein At4g35985, chloroplastic-like isoform X1 n=1 Tax=Sesamum indicum TaxID=4182 RepID=A0A6I9T3L4_SESIN|nr:senescence/dehydration-associated protein At4g35985, chloroplastic-like isoform X1 [Sesamum indicum]
MNCFKPKRSKPPPPAKTTSSPPPQQIQEIPENKNVKHEILMRIPSCRVHLMDGGEALELAAADFELLRILDENVSLATTIKVGEELQWPLTKDEPVVKLDALHYLFSLPMKDGEPLSYGVSFSDGNGADLGLLDSFLKENSLFSSSSSRSRKGDINWKEFAPAVDDYNSVLAKAIAGGTGQIVKGIFYCSNAYTNQVQKGGETILIRAAEEKNQVALKDSTKSNSNGANKKSAVNKSLKRVRKLSKMTEKMSKAMLDVVGVASGSVMAPVVRSQAGKTLLSMVPGEVLLASLDAVNKIIDAAEAAEKQAMTATSGAVTRMVTNRLGESAGEATEDALATAGHCAGTAWNVFKIRKAINPASSVPSAALRNAAKSAKL